MFGLKTPPNENGYTMTVSSWDVPIGTPLEMARYLYRHNTHYQGTDGEYVLEDSIWDYYTLKNGKQSARKKVQTYELGRFTAEQLAETSLQTSA